MSTIGCNEFLNHLDAWMEGERHPDARAHARDCEGCRRVADDLGAICETARTFATAEVELPARVWIALRAQLEQEGLICSPRRGWVEGPTHWLDRISAALPRPALAAAYLAALIAVGFALGLRSDSQFNDNSWIRTTQISTTPLGAQLATAEQDTISSMPFLNSLVTASLHENLAIVDNYIALCEKSVREEPQNEVARDYLFEAYHQKADLLAEMNERGDYGR
jgi:hypothetical protein